MGPRSVAVVLPTNSLQLRPTNAWPSHSLSTGGRYPDPAQGAIACRVSPHLSQPTAGADFGRNSILPSVLSRFAGFHRYKSTWSTYIPIHGRRELSFLPRDSNRSRVEFSTAERFEPSSRTLLIGEQPNPWGLLQSQDRASRHRGAEPWRRCERSAKTSLLSPE